MKKGGKKKVLDLRKKTLKKTGVSSELETKKANSSSQKVTEGSRARKGIGVLSSRKRIKSIWAVLITATFTALVVGGGFVGFLYWQENFAETEKDTSEKIPEEKIEGTNLVTITSDNEKIFVNFYSLENGTEITKIIENGTTIRDGFFAKENKNPTVQFSSDGSYFIALETKEPSFSDESEYARFVKYSYDGSEKEDLLESNDFLAFGNFYLNDNNIYYLSSNIDEGGEIISWNLSLLDIDTRKTKVLREDIGDDFESKLILVDGNIQGFSKRWSSVYEALYNIKTGQYSNNYLMRTRRTNDFELDVSDIVVSPLGNKLVYKDYTSWEGYNLKLYDKETRKTTTLLNDKDKNFNDIRFVSESDIVFIRSSVFASLEEKEINELVKINIENPDIEGVLFSSKDLFIPLIINDDFLVYFDGEEIVYKKGEDEKMYKPRSLMGISDILFIGEFNY